MNSPIDAIPNIIRLKQEHAELVKTLERLTDIVHARLCWQEDYGKPPDILLSFKEARAMLEKVRKSSG